MSVHNRPTTAPVPASRPASRPAAGPAGDFEEKYRPRYLADVLGQGEVIWELQEWLEAPYSTAFLFEGSTGLGKSSVARALARELGIDPDDWLDNFRQIASGQQTADTIRDLFANLQKTNLKGAGKWKVYLIEEADKMASNAAVEDLWLTGLDDLKRDSWLKVVIIFTSNFAHKLRNRVVDRCNVLTFESDRDKIGQDALALSRQIWSAETGRDEIPPGLDLDALADDGDLSFRRIVRAVEKLVRRVNGKRPAPQLRVVGMPPAPSDSGPAAGPAGPGQPMAADGSVPTRTIIPRTPPGLPAWDEARIKTCGSLAILNTRLAALDAFYEELGLACETVEHEIKACQRQKRELAKRRAGQA